MSITFTIPGRPVPAQRMTQRSKWSKRARRSLDYQEKVAWIARAKIGGMLPWRYIEAEIIIYLKVNKDGHLPGNRGDWDNLGKAVCDGMQYGEVFSNDRAITKALVDIQPCLTVEEERVEVTLSERVYTPLVEKGA